MKSVFTALAALTLMFVLAGCGGGGQSGGSDSNWVTALNPAVLYSVIQPATPAGTPAAPALLYGMGYPQVQGTPTLANLRDNSLKNSQSLQFQVYDQPSSTPTYVETVSSTPYANADGSPAVAYTVTSSLQGAPAVPTVTVVPSYIGKNNVHVPAVIVNGVVLENPSNLSIYAQLLGLFGAGSDYSTESNRNLVEIAFGINAVANAQATSGPPGTIHL